MKSKVRSSATKEDRAGSVIEVRMAARFKSTRNGTSFLNNKVVELVSERKKERSQHICIAIEELTLKVAGGFTKALHPWRVAEVQPTRMFSVSHLYLPMT